MNEWKEPIELEELPGFYYIPGNAYFGISREGIVVSLKSLKVTGQQIQNHGYWVVRRLIDGQRKSFTVHRLLGLTFIPIPDHLKKHP